MMFDGIEPGTKAVTGVVVGRVTDIDDPEDLGRVKVSFPWREADDESYWARMATPMAGAEMGAYFIPEKGDEVLVSFARGEQRFPYVLGSLWNTEQKPPKESDKDNDIRMIRSRSGHEVVLDDTENEGKVEIVTGAGNTLTLDDTSGGEKVTLEDAKAGNRLEFDAAAGSVTIAGATTLELSAKNVDIKGDANVTIEASGVLTLKGAMVQIN